MTTYRERTVGECPKCGCPESEAAGPVRHQGKKTLQRRRCAHCPARFRVVIEPVTVEVAAVVVQSRPVAVVARVVELVTRMGGGGGGLKKPPCPQCGGVAIVTSKRAKFRWLRCKSCSHPYKW